MIHPSIRDLFQSAGRHPAFLELVRRLESRETAPQSLFGLTAAVKALYLVLLWQATGRQLVVITESSKQAEALIELIETFFQLLVVGDQPRPRLVAALDVLPYQNLSPHSEISADRAITLWRLSTQRVPITVVPAAAALLQYETADFYRQLALKLKVNDEVPLEEVTAHLESIGYERREPVEMVGEYSVRGGILDVFPAEAARPVRIELFGDSVESMRRFDVETQRSVARIEECTLLPLREQPLTPSLMRRLAELAGRPYPHWGEVFPGWEFVARLERPATSHLFRLFERPVVVWDEPEQAASAAAGLWERLEQHAEACLAPAGRIFYRWEQLRELARGAQEISLRELEMTAAGAAANLLRIPSRPSMVFHGNVQLAVAESRRLVAQGGRVVFFAASNGEVERLADIFQEYSVPFQLGVDSAEGTPAYLAERAYLAGAAANTFLVKGRVTRGAILPEAGLALFGSDDLFDRAGVAVPARAPRAAFSADLGDLKPGDYVVHETHGVGRFLGLREISQGEQKGDFMLLEYAGETRLYVPLMRMDLVQKYRGAGDGAPPLDKLGGATWSRTKSRVKARMRDMADELLKLYAERKLAEGFAFSRDSNWQREFEDSFEFTETRDQLDAVRDIKRDMEDTQPMDRLLCGDVGFGKTEVAMRAAFKALGDGKQVAVLAPTTVLSFQHYETFKRRFAAFPVVVELLSRFRSPKEQKAVLEGLAEGKVDILIGTHRLLSKDVVFRDLGLLVVDEEQRFGVRHKERIKQIKKNVDVLTMTATPIPRTLHMSMVGLRDMSLIETPPKDRLAIHTVVAHFHPDLIRAAIEQELGRGGQVYFIHNRVESIWQRAAMLQELVPQSRIGVGHGQMGETELEKVLLGFMRHQYDVFVSTTIAENGLDIPLANTIIIENAERYGLSELYQLRGRVGRSNRRAYAYLLVPEDSELSEVARKRLAALKEFSDLGAGFKIAALDLELRGAGNLLGGEQSGHIAAVGYDTYVHLLEETVQELKGVEAPPEIRSTLNLGLDIRIPADYIADEQQRLRAYKRIADARDEVQARRVLEELEDRYGAAPDALRTLLEFSRLKSLAERLGIQRVERRAGALDVKFHPQAKVDPARLMDLVRHTHGAQFTPAGVLRLPLDSGQAAALLPAWLSQRLQRLAAGEGAAGGPSLFTRP